MDKFQIVKNCGDGTYGLVMEAYNKTNREFVAIKKMKKTFDTWDECMALREVRTLRKLNHPNVVKLKEVIRVHKDLYLGNSIHVLHIQLIIAPLNILRLSLL